MANNPQILDSTSKTRNNKKTKQVGKASYESNVTKLKKQNEMRNLINIERIENDINNDRTGTLLLIDKRM